NSTAAGGDRMKLTLALGICALWLTSVSAPSASADDLKCYKVKDPETKLKYTADVTGITVEPGCTIQVPAVMACVPATKKNVTPTPPGSASTETSKGLACYKLKCEKQELGGLRVDDEFGDRSVAPAAAKLLCAPVTTAFFTCGDGSYPQCGGTCAEGQVCQGFETLTGTPNGMFCNFSVTNTHCGCVDPATACT